MVVLSQASHLDVTLSFDSFKYCIHFCGYYLGEIGQFMSFLLIGHLSVSGERYVMTFLNVLNFGDQGTLLIQESFMKL